jgi:hypothetical protein
LSRSAKQHPSNSAHLNEAICVGLVDKCSPILIHSNRFTSPIPDVCHASGGCGCHKHIPKHFKHHRFTFLTSGSLERSV